jgi:hypothetical protein
VRAIGLGWTGAFRALDAGTTTLSESIAPSQRALRGAARLGRGAPVRGAVTDGAPCLERRDPPSLASRRSLPPLPRHGEFRARMAGPFRFR